MKKEPINTTPLVSIITPLHNAEKFIAQTVKSVQSQGYMNWEHILVDDASTDNSVSIVESLVSSDPRSHLIKLEENKGAAFCRNRATEIARGDFIAFLDSDDLWHPRKLEKQIAFMQSGNCAVSFTSYLHIDEAGKPLHKRIKALPNLSYKKQLRNNYIGNLTGIYHSKRLGKIMAPAIRKRQDWAVWLEAIRKSGEPALGLQEDLALYRVRKGSISANKTKLVAHNFRFYRIHLGYSWIKSLFHLFRFFWEYFLVRPRQIERASASSYEL